MENTKRFLAANASQIARLVLFGVALGLVMYGASQMRPGAGALLVGGVLLLSLKPLSSFWSK